MTVGSICFLLAAILFFLAGVGTPSIPNPSTWGLFCVALGLLLNDYDLNFRRRR